MLPFLQINFPSFASGKYPCMWRPEYLLDGKSRCFLSKYKKCVNYLTNSGDFVFLVRLVSHQRHCLFGILTPPPQRCSIVYEHLWPMTFVITVTSVRFYAAKIVSVSTIAFSSAQAGVRWHHLPCDQWVRIHTDRLGHLVLQSVKTAFVERSIPHQSHW